MESYREYFKIGE